MEALTYMEETRYSSLKPGTSGTTQKPLFLKKKKNKSSDGKMPVSEELKDKVASDKVGKGV